MTTLMQDIHAAIVALAPAGRSSDFAWRAINTTEPPAYPYVVYHAIVSTFNNSLAGSSDMQNTRIQVDVMDRDPDAADALADQVQAALVAAFASPRACIPLSSVELYEAAVKAYRISADFSIWSNN